MHAVLRHFVRRSRLVCFNSAIAFRLSSFESARNFSTAARVHQRAYSPLRPNPWYPEELASSFFSIDVPDSPDPTKWIEALEPFLPGSIRRQESLSTAPPAVALARDFSNLLIRAEKDAEINLLWHLAANEERWDVVKYIVKLLSEQWVEYGKLSDQIHIGSSIIWPQQDLEMLTCGPIELDCGLPTAFPMLDNLDVATAHGEDPRWLERRLQHSAFGQIWQSLGSMILSASASSSEESTKIMGHVLEILAVLHHNDIIPESIYRPPLSNGSPALQQPPTLHVLSSRILTALSDAAWDAHIASAMATAQNAHPSKALGRYEIPGSRHKVFVEKLGNEIWLELVLWACLHGGWVIEGATILRKMQASKDADSWTLICWRDFFNPDETHDGPIDWMRFKQESDRDRTTPLPEDRQLVERTVSAEVAAGYVDGLVNVIRVEVGLRGVPADVVLSHLKDLKQLLDQRNMGLGFTTWENIVVRIEESGGVMLENNPDLMLEILGLIQPYGKELESVNLQTSSSQTALSVPEYIFDPGAAGLGLLHRVIGAYIDLTDIDGTLKAVSAAQLFTDLNKRRALEAFFRDLQQRSQRLREPYGFFRTPMEAYPAFFPQLPIPVLCALLDLLTEARLFDIGDHFLSSSDIDGPLIPKHLYTEPAIAASLIRYGTIGNQKKLLELVLKASTMLSDKPSMLHKTALRAILESQIQRRQWNSVIRTLQFFNELAPGDGTWHTQTIAILARDILLLQHEIRTSNDPELPTSLDAATAIFVHLLQYWYGTPYSPFDEPHQELHTILGILSSINDQWATFCAGLSPKSGNQPFCITVSSFNYILDGVIAAFGIAAGKRLWDTWCHGILSPLPRFPSRGLAKMPARNPAAIEVEERVRLGNRVVLELPGGVMWEFRGRLWPRLSALRIVLRAIMSGGSDGEVEIVDESGVNISEWAMAVLRRLVGEDDEGGVERELLRVKMGLRWRGTGGKGEMNEIGEMEGGEKAKGDEKTVDGLGDLASEESEKV